MMKKGKYILIMLSLFICAYLFSNRMTPRIENIASKEINQFIQILINHTSFTQKIDTHKLYKKENNSISFQMNYINDIASNYIHNLEETLLKLEEGSYQENNHSPYNKKLLKINQQKGIVARIPIGSLTNNIFLQDRGPSFSIKYKTTLQAPGYLEAILKKIIQFLLFMKSLKVRFPHGIKIKYFKNILSSSFRRSIFIYL